MSQNLSSREAIKALVTCEGDIHLAAELLGVEAHELWSLVLDSVDDDLKQITRRVMTVGLLDLWSKFRTNLLINLDSMPPAAAAKVFSEINESLSLLLKDEKEQPTGLTFNQLNVADPHLMWVANRLKMRPEADELNSHNN